MSWREIFGSEYQVDHVILDMVERKWVKDSSERFDPAPSFSAPLHRGRWLRLWVEHPRAQKRRAGPFRYRLEVTRSLKQEGRPWIESDRLSEIIPYMLVAIEQEGFRMAGVS